MALHKDFPKDKFAILEPEIRWFPADEALRVLITPNIIVLERIKTDFDLENTIANYYPDFFIKTDEKTVYIVETKGREDFDDPLKIKRLTQWCDDANARQKKITYKMLYVKQEEWEKYKPKNLE